MKWNELPSKGPMTRERDDSGRRGVLASLNRFVVASFARFAIFFLFFLLLLLFFCAAAVKSANPTANHCQKYQRNFNRFWNRRLIRFNFSCDDIRWYWHRRQICIATLKLDWIFKRQKKKKKKKWTRVDLFATWQRLKSWRPSRANARQPRPVKLALSVNWFDAQFGQQSQRGRSTSTTRCMDNAQNGLFDNLSGWRNFVWALLIWVTTAAKN